MQAMENVRPFNDHPANRAWLLAVESGVMSCVRSRLCRSASLHGLA